MSITDFLSWLFSGIGASLVVSYIVERWGWFQLQSFDVKRLLTTISASALAIIAFVVFTYVPSGFWVTISPYWQIIVAIVATNYGTQMFHKYDKTFPS